VSRGGVHYMSSLTVAHVTHLLAACQLQYQAAMRHVPVLKRELLWISITCIACSNTVCNIGCCLQEELSTATRDLQEVRR
jgi:hypothetical protein